MRPIRKIVLLSSQAAAIFGAAGASYATTDYRDLMSPNAVTYVITDYSDPRKPKVIASGTRNYSLSDIHIKRRKNGEKFFYDKSLELATGYRIGASIFMEENLDGFGLWANHDEHSFSWEWFDRLQGDDFKKLQEGGMVRITSREQQGFQELTSIVFESDVSFRINETQEVGRVSYRILVKKGSVLEFSR